MLNACPGVVRSGRRLQCSQPGTKLFIFMTPSKLFCFRLNLNDALEFFPDHGLACWDLHGPEACTRPGPSSQRPETTGTHWSARWFSTLSSGTTRCSMFLIYSKDSKPKLFSHQIIKLLIRWIRCASSGLKQHFKQLSEERFENH